VRVLHVGTYDQAGAGIAMLRLHRALRKLGVESEAIVQVKAGDDADVMGPDNKVAKGMGYVRPSIDKLPAYLLHKKTPASFDLQWLPNKTILKAVRDGEYDLIHLHWLCEGFVPIQNLRKLGLPIVWTLHDMWAFTGGCNYTVDCEKYKEGCRKCPQLNSRNENDLSNWVFSRKLKYWANLDLSIVTPSHWLAGCAKASKLFKERRIEVIQNGLDTSVYRPIRKELAREILGLPEHKKIILFGAVRSTSDSRKGFHYVKGALEVLKKRYADVGEVELCVFGASEGEDDLGIPIRYMGRIHDDIMLVLLYSAADIFLAPSIVDNFPNTVIESMSCGVPAVAFNASGFPDMIKHKHTGYLAEAYKEGDLADGIIWLLENVERLKSVSVACRQEAVEKYCSLKQANNYLSLYQQVVRSGECVTPSSN